VYTRRGFEKLALAGIPAGLAFGKVNSTYGGVRLGVQSASFTFSGFNLDKIIETMVDVGLAEADVMSQHVENYLGAPVDLPGAGRGGPWTRQNGVGPGARPPSAPAGERKGPPSGGFAPDPAAREAMRKWRLSTPLDGFQSVGKKFKDAGLLYFSHNLSFRDDFTDEEIDRSFQMTVALGTHIITASSPLSVFPRLIPFAEKYRCTVALHNHREGPEDFGKAVELSKHFWINLDVGHFFATGNDPIAFIKANHARITNLHLKDRKANNGPDMPFGQGDTPLKEVLLLVKKEKYKFPCDIELVGPAGPKQELTVCLNYCKDALA
jgi:sugar phosphate isomerase/epimerase